MPRYQDFVAADPRRRHVAAHLAGFEVPEFVEFRHEPLPRNPAGELLENVVRGTDAVPFHAGDLA